MTMQPRQCRSVLGVGRVIDGEQAKDDWCHGAGLDKGGMTVCSEEMEPLYLRAGSVQLGGS